MVSFIRQSRENHLQRWRKVSGARACGQGEVATAKRPQEEAWGERATWVLTAAVVPRVCTCVETQGCAPKSRFYSVFVYKVKGNTETRALGSKPPKLAPFRPGAWWKPGRTALRGNGLSFRSLSPPAHGPT